MKKTVTLALTVVMLLSCVTSFAAFSDVTSDDWAYTEITAMAEKGYAVSDENGNLNPSAPLTVADLSLLPEEVKAKAISAIEKLANGTNIAAGKEITRAEFLASVIMAINATSDYKGSTFTDITDDMWYAKDVECSKEMGLVTGYEDGTFRGDSAISKREALVVGYRLNVFLEALSE